MPLESFDQIQEFMLGEQPEHPNDLLWHRFLIIIVKSLR